MPLPGDRRGNRVGVIAPHGRDRCGMACRGLNGEAGDAVDAVVRLEQPISAGGARVGPLLHDTPDHVQLDGIGRQIAACPFDRRGGVGHGFHMQAVHVPKPATAWAAAITGPTISRKGRTHAAIDDRFASFLVPQPVFLVVSAPPPL